MAHEIIAQAQFILGNGWTRLTNGYDFLDWHPISFVYLKDFIRPRDDWFVSQHLYELFNKTDNSMAVVPKQEGESVRSVRDIGVNSLMEKPERPGESKLDLDLKSIGVSVCTIFSA